LGFHRRERKASCELLRKTGVLGLRCISRLAVGIEGVLGRVYTIGGSIGVEAERRVGVFKAVVVNKYYNATGELDKARIY